MKNRNASILWVLVIPLILMICNSCAHNNLPKRLNVVDKKALKQGTWIQSNVVDNEERIIVGYYKNGILNGNYRELFTDGNLALKGQYKNGILTGRWEQYLPNGTLISWQLYDKKGNELKVGVINPIW